MSEENAPEVDVPEVPEGTSDVEQGQAETPEEPQQPEVGPDGYPLNTPVSKMSPEHQAAYWRAQARKHEKTVKAFGKLTPEQVKQMSEKIREIEDAQKTEQEKLAERLAEAERRAAEAEIARARLLAAATYNVPANLLDHIKGATEDEINEAAKALAEEIDAEVERRLEAMPKPEPEPEPEPPAAPAPTRPVESLRPGAMPASAVPEDPNEMFRRFLGRH